MKRILYGLLIVVCVSGLMGCSSVQEPFYRFGLAIERSRSDMDVKEVEVEEHTLSYLERDGSGETIVLLHGFAADKENWLRFVRHIPDRYRIIALDLPGHGESTRDFKTHYDSYSMARRFAKAAEKIGLERFHLAGNSMGGLVSILYSSDHPEKVISLGLFDSAGVLGPDKSDFFKSLDKGENPLVVTSREGFANLLELCFNKQPFLPWPARSVMAERYISRSDFNRKMWEDLFSIRDDTPVRNILPGLHMPVLILWGDNDRILDVSSTAVFRSYLPDARTALVKGCGHVPMVERPEETALKYSAFINEADARKAK